MYGTVARARVKPGGIEALHASMDDGNETSGAVAVYVYQMDADPNEIYIVAVFDSRETYVANAESSEQNARFEQMMQWLEAEPEWHDGEIVFANQF
jgi:quinol monooxygenase YgiN